MNSQTPRLNLVVIRSSNIDQAVTFYERLGLEFEKHTHGRGPKHYASITHGVVFEIYPLAAQQAPTNSTWIGFVVADVDASISLLQELSTEVLSAPKNSEWGRRAVVKDLDGHSVELIESTDEE